ncbi:MAG: flagellar protein FlaG [Epsilonproteobacteria bacterium]|nr:flagellar protein FlaG [Campylobacterota bacterium]
MEIPGQIKIDHFNEHHNANIKNKVIETVKNINENADLKDKNDKEDNKTKIEDSLKELNLRMQNLNVDIEFSLDEDGEIYYVKVKEKKSGKLIRTIPSEESMKLYKKLKEFIGIILDKKG